MTRHINLLEADSHPRRAFGAAVMVGAALAAVALGLAAAGLVTQQRVMDVRARLQAVEADLRPRQEELDLLRDAAGYHQASAETRQRLARAEAMLKARRDIRAALDRGDLGSSEGFSGTLRALARRTVPGVWLTALDIDSAARGIAITGRALAPEAVAAYLRQLGEEPALKGRSFATLRLAARQPGTARAHEFVIASVEQLTPAPAGGAAAGGVAGADLPAVAVADGGQVRSNNPGAAGNPAP
ncbi:MAG: PilN domain-containing protein [Betaproteobacteria bacterium]|nr:PilN domain-containing protein [Betaproteobacteria bacterium]